MSRRKQSNPKSIAKIANDVKENDVIEVTEQKTSHLMRNNGNISSDGEELFKDGGEGGRGRLVIDTGAEAGPDLSVRALVRSNPSAHPLSPLSVSLPATAAATRDTDRESSSNVETVSLDTARSVIQVPVAASPRACSETMVPQSGLQDSASPAAAPLPRQRQSMPSKTRRKNDKILPVATEDGKERYVCPICHLSLEDNTELTKHIRTHNANGAMATNACTICGKVLSSQSSLDRHMLVHSGERPFRCKVCKMSFTTNGNMHRHSRIHKKENAVAAANADSRENSPANSMMKEIDSEVVTTPRRPRMQRRFTEQQDLTPVNSFLPEMRADATLYPNRFSRVDSIASLATVKRRLDMGSQENQPPVKRSMTTLFPAKYRTKEEISDKNEDETSIICFVCGKSFPSRGSLEVHTDSCHPLFSLFCQLCGQKFLTHQELVIHKNATHALLNQESEWNNGRQNFQTTPVGFFDIDFVDFTGPNFSFIARVWCEKYPRVASSIYHNFTCRVCSRAFPTENALEQHNKTHMFATPTACVTCDTNFENAHMMEKHNTVHQKEMVIAKIFENRSATASNDDIRNDVQQADFMSLFQLGSLKTKVEINDFPKLKDDAPIAAYEHKFQEICRKGMRLPVMTGTQDFADVTQILQLTAGIGNKTQGATSLSPHPAFPYGSLAPSMPRLPQYHMPPMFPSMQRQGHQITPQSHPMPSHGHILQSAPHNSSMLRPSPLPVQASMLFPPPPSQATTSSFIRHPPQSLPPTNPMVASTPTESQDVFKCKYCGEVYTNSKEFKGHMRSHMGLSPYKCNLCSYSSADKSTLIRHYRTHNGERPFLCLLCEFAFTTKANCERHVRKKHHRFEKDSIEKAIGYSKTNSPNSEQFDFASPDTVCKICGEDLKFFRTLKQHMRSHNDNNIRPYSCRICSGGFNSKSSCLYHVQKQHPEVPEVLVEEAVSVVDLRAEMESPEPGEIIRPKPESLASPPVAHLGGASNAALPITRQLLSQNIKPKPEARDLPLDYSTKASDSLTAEISSPDEPMDLSLPGRRRSVSPSQKMASPSLIERLHAPPLINQRCEQKETFYNNSMMPHKEVENTERLRTPDKPPTTKFDYWKLFGKPKDEPEITIENLFCYYCKKLFTTKAVLEKHLMSCTVRQAETDMANMHDFSDEDLDDEIEVTRDDEDNEEAMELGSNDDDSDFPSATNSITGIYHGDGIIKLNRQKIQEVSNNGDKKKRNSYADSPHKLLCPYCPRAFPWISSLKRHLLTHTESIGQKPFKCPQCPVTFSTKSNRERHLIRKHNLHALDPATRQMMDRPFKCHLCVFSSFSTLSNLEKHYQEKHPAQSIPESLLDVAAMQSENIAAKESEQSAVDRLQEAVFQASALHAIQNEPEDEQCSEVLAEATPSPSAESHKSASAANELIKDARHMIIMNPERDNYNVDKITNCWKCCQTFPSRKSLVKHLKEHNIDYSFKCYLCDASFDSRFECLNHKEQVHPSDWHTLKDKNKVDDVGKFCFAMERIVEENFLNNNCQNERRSEYNDDIDSDYAQRKVYCSLCPKRFWSLQDLRRHMRSHTGERPFECNICQKRFTLKHSMMRHRRKHGGQGPDDVIEVLSNSEDEACSEDGPELRSSPTMAPAKQNPTRSCDWSANFSNENSFASLSEAESSKADMLQNLLGIEASALDKMLDNADSAAKLLGVKP